MLITLSAKSLASAIADEGDDLTLSRLPAVARADYELMGLTLQTSFLAGWDVRQIERLRDEADKAACPWLTLVEDRAHPLASEAPDADEAMERLARVLRVAHRLGCSGVSLAVAEAPDDTIDLLSERLRDLIAQAERLELNILLAPVAGLTEKPDDLTALIRSVGGFRIGAMPDFEVASGSDDPVEYLRRLTPYASTVIAATTGFSAAGKHTAYDLATCIEAIDGVGFEGNLCIEYRGPGDPRKGIAHAHAAITALLEDEA